jgi:hypothetical protein
MGQANGRRAERAEACEACRGVVEAAQGTGGLVRTDLGTDPCGGDGQRAGRDHQLIRWSNSGTGSEVSRS